MEFRRVHHQRREHMVVHFGDGATSLMAQRLTDSEILEVATIASDAHDVSVFGALLSAPLHDLTADHFELNLTGSLEDREHPRVAPEPLRVEFHRVAIAAVDLHR